LTHETGRSITS